MQGVHGIGCATSRRASPRPVSRRARAEAQISRVHNTGFKASESRVPDIAGWHGIDCAPSRRVCPRPVSRRARAEAQISRVHNTGFKASESRAPDITGSHGIGCAPSRHACPRPTSRRARAEAQISRVHNTGFKASESREAEGTTRARYAAEQRRAAGRNKYGHLAARRLTAVAPQRIGVAAADGGTVGQTGADRICASLGRLAARFVSAELDLTAMGTSPYSMTNGHGHCRRVPMGRREGPDQQPQARCHFRRGGDRVCRPDGDLP